MGPAVSECLQWIFTMFAVPKIKQIRLGDDGIEVCSGQRARLTMSDDNTKRDKAYYERIDFRPEITKLSPINGCLPANETNNLVLWCSGLVHISFKSEAFLLPSHFSSRILQDMLNAHRGILQYIELPLISTDNYFQGRIPDFSDFLSLKELSMYAYNCFYENAKRVAFKLSAPSLHRISLDLNNVDQHFHLYHDFGEAEVRWMYKFAKRIKPDSSSSNGLQTLHLHFSQDIDELNTGNSGISPWDCIEEAE